MRLKQYLEQSFNKTWRNLKNNFIVLYFGVAEAKLSPSHPLCKQVLYMPDMQTFKWKWKTIQRKSVNEYFQSDLVHCGVQWLIVQQLSAFSCQKKDFFNAWSGCFVQKRHFLIHTAELSRQIDSYISPPVLVIVFKFLLHWAKEMHVCAVISASASSHFSSWSWK